jgi:2-C-methyl-D-erythritol 4-phosphate cytidylyltransferase
MNVALILSGGSGQRFGTDIPKQYQDLCGKMVVQYVIEAAKNASSVNKILAVADANYVDMFNTHFNIECTLGGKSRNESLKCGLENIKNNYPYCRKVILLVSARPFITPQIIDDFFTLLEKEDCVVAAYKVVEFLGSHDKTEFDREKFFLMAAPFAFNFEKLFAIFDDKKEDHEVAQFAKTGYNIYKYYDFYGNLKITYKKDLELAKLLIKHN